MRSNFIPYEMKTTYLKIYSYDGRNPLGILENSYYNKPLYFENLTALLILIETLLDELKNPQRFMEERHFNPENSRKLVEEAFREPPVQGKPMASFKLNILFRQNASWQGNLVWQEENAESPFRSALELIMLLDEALLDDKA